MIKIIYLIFFLSVLLTIASANDKFLLSSLDEAQVLSKDTKKPILLIFGADYCVHCGKLKHDLLNKDLEESADNYIICYMDIQTNPDLKKKYGVSIIPDSRIIKSDKTVSSMTGYSKNTYAKWLKNDHW